MDRDTISSVIAALLGCLCASMLSIGVNEVAGFAWGALAGVIAGVVTFVLMVNFVGSLLDKLDI